MNSKDQVFFVGQKAFIRNSHDQLLVLLDPISGLDLPGGKVQSDEEDLKASLQREVMEETGLQISVGDAFYTWRFHYPIENVDQSIRDARTDGNIYRVGFECILENGDIALSVEHTKFRWITEAELPDLKSWGGDYDAVAHYFSKQNKLRS